MTIVPPEGPSPFDQLRDPDNRWSTRKLQILMGYSRWENLAPALKRAMASARNEGLDVEDNFLRSQEVAGQRGPAREDFRLTRHAAYLLAMNGDPSKPEVAAAQAYFARKTREAEIAKQPVALPSNRDLALMVIAEADRADLAEAKVKELEPAAQSWTVLAAADGDFSVADAAKILARDPRIQTGPRRLFTLLISMKWAYRQLADNRPRAMQYAVERGWLSEIPQSHVHRETGEAVIDAPQVRVTVKGLQELHKRLGGETPLQLSA